MAIFIGALALAILFTGGAFAAWRLRTLPIRWACPECHHATAPILRPGMRRLRRRLQWRWCPRCHWGGWSRPRRVKVKTQSLASVLREAVEGTLPSARAFQWAPPSKTPPAPRFRWAHEVEEGRKRRAGQSSREKDAVGSAHASGFRWAGDADAAAPEKVAADHPSGFHWADPMSSPGAPVFQWKESKPAAPMPPAPLRWVVSALARSSSEGPGSQGFTWASPGNRERRPGARADAPPKAPSGKEPDFFEWEGGEDDAGDTFGFRWKE